MLLAARTSSLQRLAQDSRRGCGHNTARQHQHQHQAPKPRRLRLPPLLLLLLRVASGVWGQKPARRRAREASGRGLRAQRAGESTRRPIEYDRPVAPLCRESTRAQMMEPTTCCAGALLQPYRHMPTTIKGRPTLHSSRSRHLAYRHPSLRLRLHHRLLVQAMQQRRRRYEPSFAD